MEKYFLFWRAGCSCFIFCNETILVIGSEELDGDLEGCIWWLLVASGSCLVVGGCRCKVRIFGGVGEGVGEACCGMR